MGFDKIDYIVSWINFKRVCFVSKVTIWINS